VQLNKYYSNIILLGSARTTVHLNKKRQQENKILEGYINLFKRIKWKGILNSFYKIYNIIILFNFLRRKTPINIGTDSDN